MQQPLSHRLHCPHWNLECPHLSLCCSSLICRPRPALVSTHSMLCILGGWGLPLASKPVSGHPSICRDALSAALSGLKLQKLPLCELSGEKSRDPGTQSPVLFSPSQDKGCFGFLSFKVISTESALTSSLGSSLWQMGKLSSHSTCQGGESPGESASIVSPHHMEQTFAFSKPQTPAILAEHPPASSP